VGSDCTVVHETGSAELVPAAIVAPLTGEVTMARPNADATKERPSKMEERMANGGREMDG